MTFYFDDNTFINGAYLRSKLLFNDQTPDISNYKEISDINKDSNLSQKLSFNTVTYDSNTILQKLFNENDFDENNFSKLLVISKTHLIAILYLYITERLNTKEIIEILDSTNDKNRANILLEKLNIEDENSNLFFSPLINAMSLLNVTSVNDSLKNQISKNIDMIKSKLENSGVPKSINFPSYGSMILAKRGNFFKYGAYLYRCNYYDNLKKSWKTPALWNLKAIRDNISADDFSFYNYGIMPLDVDSKDAISWNDCKLNILAAHKISMLESAVNYLGKQIKEDIDLADFNTFVAYNLLSNYNSLVNTMYAQDGNKLSLFKISDPYTEPEETEKPLIDASNPPTDFLHRSLLIPEYQYSKNLSNENIGARIFSIIKYKKEVNGVKNELEKIITTNKSVNDFLEDLSNRITTSILNKTDSLSLFEEIINKSSIFNILSQNAITFTSSENNVIKSVSSNLKVDSIVKKIATDIYKQNLTLAEYNESAIIENIQYICKKYQESLDSLNIMDYSDGSDATKLGACISYCLIKNYIAYINDDTKKINDFYNSIFNLKDLKILLLLASAPKLIIDGIKEFNIDESNILKQFISPADCLLESDKLLLVAISNRWKKMDKWYTERTENPIDYLYPKKGD